MAPDSIPAPPNMMIEVAAVPILTGPMLPPRVGLDLSGVVAVSADQVGDNGDAGDVSAEIGLDQRQCIVIAEPAGTDGLNNG